MTAGRAVRLGSVQLGGHPRGDPVQFFGGGFGGFTGRAPRRQGRDLAVTVDMTLDEASTGSAREVSYPTAVVCDTCSGAGAATGTSPTRCGTCGGTGQMRVTRSTFLGSMMTVAECSTCGGWGEVIASPCPMCSGRGRVDDTTTITVDIPAGVDHGTRLRLGGRGEAGERRTRAGDLYVTVRMAPDERFTRVGDDLHHTVRLGVAEATLGVDLKVPLVGGELFDVAIPPGTQPGTVYRIDRQGMPRLRRRGRGDLLVEVEVLIPTDLDEEQTDAMRHFGDLHGESPAPGPQEAPLLHRLNPRLAPPSPPPVARPVARGCHPARRAGCASPDQGAASAIRGRRRLHRRHRDDRWWHPRSAAGAVGPPWPRAPDGCPSPRVTLAVAPPHDAGRARFLVEKAAELGVAELRWVTTAATQGKPPQPARSSAWASAALEQSRGAHVTVISGPVPVGDVDGDAVVADPGAGAVDPEWWAGGDVTLLIGPEGGLRPDEVARFTRRMGLGERVLRTETAAVVAAAVVFDLARRAEKSRR